jgi:hypothetical protein
MAQSQDITKAASFITYLLQSPQMKNENLFTAESMIHNFLFLNREHLKTTFTGPQYFPHLNPDDAIKLVTSELFAKIREHALVPVLKDIDNTDYSCMNKIGGSEFPAAYHKDSIRKLAEYLFDNKDVRGNFAASYNIIQNNIIDRYINDIFHRRDFIYNELVRVQKTYLEADEYIVYLKVLLLLKNAVHMKVPLSSSDSEHLYSLADVLKMPGKLPQYISMLANELRTQSPNLPDKTVSLAVKANVPDTMTALEEGSSRFLYILCARFHNFKPQAKVDRGAETPDKSWFAIARKNAKLFGFEKNMLEEFYRIAGDNNW